MKKKIFRFSAMGIIAAMFIVSCNDGETKTTEVVKDSFSIDSAKSAIAASNKVYGETFAKGDSTAFVNLYTKDACLYVANMPAICGPQGLKAFFNGGYAMGIRNIKLTTDEVVGGKDGVAETGKYELFADKNVTMDKGKFIVVWKQEDGKWKMYRDEFTSDMPMMTQAKK